MSADPCRECGREISTEAVICPHCGVPRPSPRGQLRRAWRKWQIWATVGSVISLFAFVSLGFAEWSLLAAALIYGMLWTWGDVRYQRLIAELGTRSATRESR